MNLTCRFGHGDIQLDVIDASNNIAAMQDYYYAEKKSIHTDTVTIDGDEFHHLIRVMRKNIGDRIHVTDGGGVVYHCAIERIERDAAVCKIVSTEKEVHELPRRIVLVQAMLKQPAKFDWIVEKATELGVHEIVPCLSERAIAKSAKVDRWQHLALAAMKQSLRCRLPSVTQPISFEEALRSYHDALCLVCHESASDDNTVERAIIASPSTQRVVIFIGPEGGFSEEEISSAATNDTCIVSLGLTRLRSETAAIAALSRAHAALLMQSHNHDVAPD